MVPWTVSALTFIVGMFIGYAVGWTHRSIRFAIDEDCANPKHRDRRTYGAHPIHQLQEAAAKVN